MCTSSESQSPGYLFSLVMIQNDVAFFVLRVNL